MPGMFIATSIAGTLPKSGRDRELLDKEERRNVRTGI
jgi:hypothetical protein